MKKSVQLTQRKEKKALLSEKERYQAMTESIIFSMIETRPDIIFTTLLVSRFAKNLSYQYIKAIKTIMKYFKSPKNQRITYSEKEELKIKSYSDSDWACDKES